MKRQLHLFFEALDRAWKPLNSARQPLPIIGAGALMLQTDYERGTKDGDVLQTAAISGAVKERLLAIAGRGTALHKRHRLYLDVVGGGIPFLPQSPTWHLLTDLGSDLSHFEIHVLDVVDVVVSKLKRFHANDKADVSAMVARNLVDHALLVKRFQAAVDVWKDGAGADDLPKYLANLHSLERDVFLVPESEIELPSWI